MTASVVASANERALLLNGRRQPPSYTVSTSEVTLNKPSTHYNLAGLDKWSFWALCLSVWMCSFLNAFDGTIVATLLGPISSNFKAANMASWLGTSYMLSVCCFTPVYGRLSNILGRRESMMIALFFFTIGNGLCAIAPNMYFLIAARSIAGLGGGGIQTTGATITSDIVPIMYRGIFQGYTNIMFGLGMGLGAPLGGIINDTLGWRAAFLVQIPILVTAGIFIHLKVRYTLQQPNGSLGTSVVNPVPAGSVQSFRAVIRRIDFLGIFLLAGWLGSFIVAFSLKTQSTDIDAYAWTDLPIASLLVLSVILFVVFLYVELRFAAEPVIPLELLKRRTPISVAINNFVISIMMFGLNYSVPLFFTTVRQLSASKAGAHLIPNSMVGTLGSLCVGFIVKATGKYYWLCAFCSLGAIFSTIILSTWSETTADWILWTTFMPSAFTGGSVPTLTIVGLMADVGRDHIAMATSLSYFFRTAGQVLGVSLSGALTQAVLQQQLIQRITGPNAVEVIASIRQSSASISSLPPSTRAAAILSYQMALRAVFKVAIVLGVVTLLASLGMSEMEIQLKAPTAKAIDDEEVPRPQS